MPHSASPIDDEGLVADQVDEELEEDEGEEIEDEEESEEDEGDLGDDETEDELDEDDKLDKPGAEDAVAEAAPSLELSDTAAPEVSISEADGQAGEVAAAPAILVEAGEPVASPAAPLAHRAFAVGRLRGRLLEIDGQSYRAYREIEGEYRFEQFFLHIDFVQPDPYAPSRLRVRVPAEIAEIPARLFETPVRERALRDYLTRGFAAAIERHVRGGRGAGESGQIRIAVGGAEILERTSCVITPEHVEVRFSASLPTDGRVALGRQALAMLLDELPRVVKDSLLYSGLGGGVHRHIAAAEDQAALREQLAERKLVAFVANGSILPRASGSSQGPLLGSGVVPFESPPELRVELVTPNQGTISGMGVPRGVTLIVGGGFHGKSTLLAAIERGVYDHVPGDGRENVVTRPDAVKVRAEAGRSVERVDISPFVDNLPFGKEMGSFSTDSAVGSTSQAAAIVEALEVGARLLLVDEDTSASNLMFRDARMQRLIPKADESISPLVDHVRALYEDQGVSTVLAIGGSGDYLDVADTVIAMRDYRPRLATAEARQIAGQLSTQRTREPRGRIRSVGKRSAAPESLGPTGRGRERVQARALDTLVFGETRIDLGALDQLADVGQTRAIGDLIAYCLRRGYFDRDSPIVEVLARGLSDVDARGLEILAPFRSEGGEYARPRLHEAVAAVNRWRGLRAKQVGV